MSKKAFKYRFYPTPEQVELLAKTFGCTRFVYNTILRWRTDCFYQRQERIGYIQANAELTRMKQSGQFQFLNEVSCVPLQQVLRHQQTAFKNFFEGRARYPVFKKKHSKQSIELTKSAFNYKDGKLYIAKCKTPLNIKWSQPLSSEPTTVTISKDCMGRYFVSCLCDFETESLPINPNTIGIDVGLESLFTTDSGIKIDNPRRMAKYESKLAKAQRVLSKKKLGSKNRNKARLKVARIHAKIADSRLDNLHKLSRRLVNENQVICVETLKVKAMIKDPKYSKHIADASWGEFIRQLEYKAKWAGRELVKIDQFYPSSKRCSCCGHVMNSMPTDIREWSCPKCNALHDRDVNAAINIKAAGLAVLALGENVSQL